MKKANWFVVMGVSLLSACFMACSDDDGGGDSWEGKSVTVDCDPYDAWSYFSFKEGKTVRTLNVKSVTGAVTGVYYGNLSNNALITNADSLLMVINEGVGDTIVVSFPEVKVGGMGGGAPVAASFSLKALAKKENDMWKISSEKTVVTMEKADSTSTDYYMNINGEIGTSKDAEFNLNLVMNVKKMADMGVDMNMGGTFTGKSTGKSYAVDGDESAFEWDLAFHRYNIKTNGGAAVMLQTTDLSAVTLADIDGKDFTADVERDVMVDMSGMMKGFVGYQTTNINSVLGKWVTATPTGSMPPYTYEINNSVFIVKTASGEYAKVRFTDMSDATGKNEAASFDYEFPLQ